MRGTNVPLRFKQQVHLMLIMGTAIVLSSPIRSTEPVKQADNAIKGPAVIESAGLTLTQLVAKASEQNPDWPIALARVEAARGKWVQAGLYPNPELSWQANQIGHRHNAAGEEGPILLQPIVTAGKLRLAQAAASEGIANADWLAVTRWFDVVTRVRLAYYEVLTAEKAVETSKAIVQIGEQGLDIALQLQKAGAGTQPDILRARVELEQNRMQLGVIKQRLTAAWRALGVVTGALLPADAAVSGDLEKPAPQFDWEPVLSGVLTRNSDVHAAMATVLQTEQLVRLARAEVIPNINVTVRPFYSFPDQNMRGLVQWGGMVPIYNRNQGNILAAQADVARAKLEVRQVELRLTDRLTIAFQRYRAAQEQVTAFENQILPDATEALRLVRLGYEKGDPKYDYTAFLQAQRILVQARLLYVQALGELWLGVSEIQGLLQLNVAPENK